METEMVVCNCYKLFRNGKSFTKEGKQLKRIDIAITRDYMDDCNYNWKTLGIVYEENEVKTKKFYKLKEKTRLAKIKNTEISKKVAENLTNMLDLGNDVIEDVEEEAVVEEIKDIEVVSEKVVVEDAEPKEIITGMGNLKVAYLEIYGKHVPVNKKNDIDWISKKVNG